MWILLNFLKGSLPLDLDSIRSGEFKVLQILLVFVEWNVIKVKNLQGYLDTVFELKLMGMAFTLSLIYIC